MATTNNYYKIKHGLEAPSQDTIQVTESTRPTIRPTLNLNFAQAKVLDPRITFARASTATYYGTETALAEQNLMLQSQTFDVTWGKVGSSVTVDSTTAPDGTTTADTLVADGASSPHYMSQSIAAGATQKVLSVFLKAGTNNFAQIWVSGDSNGFVNFDLSSGTVGTVGSSFTASIVSVGSGWYRCIVVTSSATAISFSIAIVSSGTAVRNETNALATTVFVWGAQLEQRSSVTAYTVTTTQPVTNYVPVLETAAAGVARFDHNPTTFESLGLMVEQQSTNLLLRSEEFGTTWTTQRTSILANQAIAPDGTLTGDKLIASTDATTTHNLYQSYSLSASTFTLSCYAKAGEYSGFRLYWTEGVNPSADFNLLTGTVVSAGAGVTATITPVGNGWYRCIYTKTNAGTGNNPILSVGLNGSTFSYTGDGYSGIYIWGAQLEAGAFATSYIPTVASQVTRAADAASMTGTNFSSWYNQAEGSFYIEAVQNATSSTSAFAASMDNSAATGNSSVTLFYLNNTASSIQLTSFDPSGNIQVDMGGNSPPLVQGVFKKSAFALKLNDFAQSSDGGAVQTDTTGVMPNPNSFGLGFRISSSDTYLNGRIRKIAYYPLRLSNTNLLALTG